MNLIAELKAMNTQCKVDLSELSLDELKNVITVAEGLARSKEREAKEGLKEKALLDLKVGDPVMVSGKKFIDEIWEVLKLNPTKVKCKRENGETWNIPYANIIM